MGTILSSPALWIQVVFVFFLFIANFGILFGPLLAMNLTQIKTFEPGDAQWGVKLDDVRGQAEAKEEVRRVVSIWQSGEQFERHGGKRERGVLFFGPPGTGKTMLAKALATGFNSPFVSIPGSGFAATFIGIDAIVVRYLAWKAKRAARKWGGTCIVFIDEIDAVGMRRASLGTGFGGNSTAPPLNPMSMHDELFYGPWGSLDPSGDMILETRSWRERLFASRETPTFGPSTFAANLMRFYGFMFPGGMGGGMGGMALNQLLVVMDGIDNPPFMKRVITNKTNTLLDASFIVPRRVGGRSLRLPAPRPRDEQVYFIGATNVPIDRLDPALIRPGRMGRHVWFRTPTKNDRLDIIDLYINKVSHDPELDMPRRRDEIARVTNGYSPAMIEQVTSMALTIAHHSGRGRFSWEDLVEVDHHPRVRHGDRDRVRRARGSRDLDPRGRSRDRRARLHEGLRVDASLDPPARRLGRRPPPGPREGGAVRTLPERDVRAARLGPRRDGGGARVLRRELDRCRRRRDVGDRPGRRHGRRGRDGSAAVRCDAGGGRDRGRGPAARARPDGGHRPADHEPDGRRGRPDGARPHRRRALRPVQASRRRADHRAGVRRRAQPRVDEPRGTRPDRRRADGEEGDLRGRPDRPAQLGRPSCPRARLQRRGDLAGAVLRRSPRPSAGLSRGRSGAK